MQIMSDDGGKAVLNPGDVYDIPPGDDASALGDDTVISLEFRGFRNYSKPPVNGDRMLSTLLFTDIVASTATAVRLGDEGWKELLSRYYDQVRTQLDQFRGVTIDTAKDGLLVQFDGAVRAIRCADAIRQMARRNGIQVRSGIHTGEVEIIPQGLRGIAIHIAARIMTVAEPDEILLSSPTVELL
jgi:class 3 adenylate cyclase